MLSTGWGGPPDSPRALKILEQACNQGDAEGCGNWGAAYEMGDIVTRDLNRARELFDQACNGGSKIACGRLKKLGQPAT